MSRYILTATDAISEAIFKDFQQGKSLKDISTAHHVSLDQVKRLKRFYNYLEQLIEYPELAQPFQQLGLKALSIASLMKPLDVHGLFEVLSQVTEQTSRNELKDYLQRYQEKKVHVQTSQQKNDTFSEKSKTLMDKLLNTMGQLQQKKKSLQEQLGYVEKYPFEVHEILMAYIAPYRGGYALRKRIDSYFRRTLEKDGIIQIDEDYIYVVLSLDQFVERLYGRIKRNLSFHYDVKMETTRAPLYANQTDLYQNIRTHTEEIEAIDQELKQIATRIEKLQKEEFALKSELDQMKQTHILSFEEASHAAQIMLERDILRHKELETLAMKWLYSKGYTVCNEVTLPNNRRVDVIGYKDEQFIIIEVKASIEDYRRDDKWPMYLPYCDEFYFLMDFYPSTNEVGCLMPGGTHSIIEKQADRLEHTVEDRERVKILVSRALSAKLIYGNS